MQLQLAVVAQSVAVDRFTNRLSLFNIVEQIEVPSFPVLMPELVFVTVLRRTLEEPSRFDTNLIVRLAGTVIAQANIHVDFEDKLSSRQLTNFQNMPILMAGDLEMQFRLEGVAGELVSATVPVIQSALPRPAQSISTAPQGI